MFRSVLEVMLQTGARWRRNSGLVRMMLAELHPGLAKHALESGRPAMPMNWRNWHRFLPAAPVYARKGLAKVTDRIGMVKSTAGNLPPRMILWQDGQIRELLRPEEMLVGEMFERQRLREFLAASQNQNFEFNGQWQRLLSLEMTLRFLRSEFKSIFK